MSIKNTCSELLKGYFTIFGVFMAHSDASQIILKEKTAFVT